MDKKEKIKTEIEAVEESMKYFKSRVKDNEELKSKLEAELAELEQENQELELEYGDDYWFVNIDTMHIDNDIWHDTLEDDIRLKRKLIFKTSDEAEEYLEYLKAKEKAMNEFSKEEWEDENIDKSYIYYDYGNNKIITNYAWHCRGINEMYFRTEEATQNFINKYENFLRRELKE